MTTRLALLKEYNATYDEEKLSEMTDWQFAALIVEVKMNFEQAERGLLKLIDNIQLATTYALAANEPSSKYFESMESTRDQYLTQLDDACIAYLKSRNVSL